MASKLVAAADEVEIRVLLDRYFHAMDARDWTSFAGCFAEAAEMVLHYGSSQDALLIGRSTIAKTIQGRIESYDATVHARGNVRVVLDGDRASSSTFAVANILLKGHMLVRGLRYQDELERGSDGWRIAKRLHSSTWQYESPAYTPSIVHQNR